MISVHTVLQYLAASPDFPLSGLCMKKMKGEGLGVFIVTDCDVCDVWLDRQKGRGAPDQNDTFYAHVLYPEH